MPPLPLEPKGNRVLLAGRGDELLGLVLRHAPARQWTLWLHLPLIGAAADGDVDFVKDLFAAGASGGAGQRGEDGCTLLHAAAKGGSTKVVQALLEAGSGPDVNRPKLSGNQEYPLHIAAKLGHVGVSMALIEAGADVSCRDRNGWSPLHLAARFGQIEVVMNLLRAGADREAVDVNGYRPLHYSTMWSHPATTKTLLKAGAALESITRVDGTRPLHIAARYGSALVVRELLGQGAEMDAKNSRGFTALHAAASSNKVGAISLLLAAGADVDLPSGDERLRPLHLAARRGAVEAASALLEAGAAVGARAIDGNTPLHIACTLLKSSAVKLLLDYGADENALNVAQQTPGDVVASNLSDDDRDNATLVEKVKEILLGAPAARAWRRRGWLVMARARLLKGGDGIHRTSRWSRKRKGVARGLHMDDEVEIGFEEEEGHILEGGGGGGAGGGAGTAAGVAAPPLAGEDGQGTGVRELGTNLSAFYDAAQVVGGDAAGSAMDGDIEDDLLLDVVYGSDDDGDDMGDDDGVDDDNDNNDDNDDNSDASGTLKRSAHGGKKMARMLYTSSVASAGDIGGSAGGSSDDVGVYGGSSSDMLDARCSYDGDDDVAGIVYGGGSSTFSLQQPPLPHVQRLATSSSSTSPPDRHVRELIHRVATVEEDGIFQDIVLFL